MRGDIGQIFLMLAGSFALMQGVSGLMGGVFQKKPWQEVCRLTSLLHFACISAAFLTLVSAYIFCDFSLFNVFLNDHTSLLLIYRFCAVWGNHEGSMLLWSTILGLMSLTYVWGSKSQNQAFCTLTLGIQGFISGLFLLFLWFWSNPFDLVQFPPQEGLGLNPLLQDRSLIIHPPLLYLGYVGFSLPFSMALTALILLEKSWAFWARPFVLLAWSFLTLGIGWGSLWAYYELGWGGWWFWDPVENVALMPWLTGTALVHTLKVTQRDGRLNRWSLFLALFTFSLSLLGTFLVRAGVLSSVHSFAHDPERGFILMLIFALTSGTGFAFWGWRLGEKREGKIAFLSREGGIWVQSLFLVGATAIIALGTLFPLLWESFSGEKIALGPAYFNTILIPLMAVPFTLMPLTPFLSWGKGDIFEALRSLIFAGTISLTGLWGIWTFWDFPSLMAGIGAVLALWIGSGTLSLFKQEKSRDFSFYGMVLAHIGVAICLAGMTGSSFWRVEAEKMMSPGSTLSVGPYALELTTITLDEGPNYHTSRAILKIQKEEKTLTTLSPERRLYHPQEVLLSKTAIYTTGFSDLYLVLGNYCGPNQWQIQAYYTPLVPWIWLGVIVIFVGGMLCCLGRLAGQTLSAKKRSLAMRSQEGSSK